MGRVQLLFSQLTDGVALVLCKMEIEKKLYRITNQAAQVTISCVFGCMRHLIYLGRHFSKCMGNETLSTANNINLKSRLRYKFSIHLLYFLARSLDFRLFARTEVV